jgi:hypothetical protein
MRRGRRTTTHHILRTCEQITGRPPAAGPRREDLPDATLVDAVAAFVAAERKPFQPPPGADTIVWVEPGSDVNHWTLLYATGGVLAYIAFDQG